MSTLTRIERVLALPSWLAFSAGSLSDFSIRSSQVAPSTAPSTIRVN